MRAEREVPSRTAVHTHPHAHSFLNLQLFLHRHTPSNGSKTPPSLTQPRPYLASHTTRHSHADARRALAFPLSAFLRQTASFLNPLFTELEPRRASGWDDFPSEMTWMGMESHRVVDDITYPPLRSFRAGVDSQCERIGEALMQAPRNDIRLLTLCQNRI